MPCDAISANRVSTF